MKICTKCGRPEGEVKFSSQRRECQSCRKAYQRTYYAENKPYFKGYHEARKVERTKQMVAANRRARHERYAKLQAIQEANPCTDCGQKFSYVVMDFDHRDASTKVADVSTLVKQWSWGCVEAEIAKCDLVCVCCHRLRTYKGDNSYRTRRFSFHRVVLDELKSTTPCLDCGEHFEPCQMDFDHLPSKVKSATIARLVERSTKVLLAELAKCHLVCANCHRIRSHTGNRPQDPEHRKVIVAKFKEIAARTPLPEDKRVGEFPFPELLGTMSDDELAAKASKTITSKRSFESSHFKNEGISKEMVAYYRRKADIPAFKPKPKTVPKPWHKLLGTVPDVEVAKLVSRSPATIHYHRTRLRIPPFKDEHVEATA